MSLAFDPILPYPQIAVLAIAGVILAVWLYRTSSAAQTKTAVLLTALRGIGIALIVLLLLNPVVLDAHRDSGKPPLLIMLDRSRSMKITDVGGVSRFQAAIQDTLGDSELLTDIQRHYDCRLYSMADTATREDMNAFAGSAKPDGAHTKIGESMAAAIGSVAGSQSGAMLIVSDGRNNGEADAVEAARQSKARHFPVFTMCLGTANQGRDVSLLNRRPQVFAAPTQDVPLTAQIRSVGYTGQTARVDLLHDGKTVQTQSLTLNDHRPTNASFTVHQDKEGSYRYAIAVNPLSGEATTVNNRGSVFLQVLKSRARVLLLEGRPSWDAKFLMQALHSDPSIDVDALYKLTEDKVFAVAATTDAGGKPAALTTPKTAADFAKYDVVIVGKGYEDFFDAAATDALKSFVGDHGGNVIFLRGNPGDAPANLAALEPLHWSTEQIDGVRMHVTDEGRRNPAFDFPVNNDPDLVIQKLPTLTSATKVDGEKALSVVLARANGVQTGNKEMAVLAYQDYGRGKSVSLVGDGLWRWALLPPDLKDYGGCYNDFWTQLVRWMVNQSDFLPGQNLSLKTDRSSYAPGETVHIMAFTRDKKTALPPVTLQLPNGGSTTVTLTHGGGAQADFVGSFQTKQPGEYLAQITPAGGQPVLTPFSVFPDQEEDLVTAADPEMMREIAEAGGGELVTAANLRDLPLKLKDAQTPPSSNRGSKKSAWDTGLILGLLIGIFSLEWALRRRWGLL